MQYWMAKMLMNRQAPLDVIITKIMVRVSFVGGNLLFH